MKKRGTISRCCCGGGGAGQCLDACLPEFSSSCPFGVSGQLFFDATQAADNCGWFRSSQGNVLAISGENGNFSGVGSFRVATALVEKTMAFDYRNVSTITLSYTSEIDIVPYTTIPTTIGWLVKEFGILHKSHYQGPRNAPIPYEQFPPMIIYPGGQVEAGQSADIQMVIEFGQTLSSDRIELQGIETCRDEKEVSITTTIDGVVMPTLTTSTFFAGVVCRLRTKIDMRQTTRDFISTATSNANLVTS